MKKHPGKHICHWCLKECIDRLDCNNRHKTLFNKYKTDKFHAYKNKKKKRRQKDEAFSDWLDRNKDFETLYLKYLNDFENAPKIAVSTIPNLLRAYHSKKIDNSHLGLMRDYILERHPEFEKYFERRK